MNLGGGDGPSSDAIAAALVLGSHSHLKQRSLQPERWVAQWLLLVLI